MKDEIQVSSVQLLDLVILALPEFWVRFFLAGAELMDPLIPKCGTAPQHLFGASL